MVGLSSRSQGDQTWELFNEIISNWNRLVFFNFHLPWVILSVLFFSPSLPRRSISTACCTAYLAFSFAAILLVFSARCPEYLQSPMFMPCSVLQLLLLGYLPHATTHFIFCLFCGHIAHAHKTLMDFVWVWQYSVTKYIALVAALF